MKYNLTLEKSKNIKAFWKSKNLKYNQKFPIPHLYLEQNFLLLYSISSSTY